MQRTKNDQKDQNPPNATNPRPLLQRRSRRSRDGMMWPQKRPSCCFKTSLIRAFGILTQIAATMSSEALQPVVFSGPSGVGKGTLIEMLQKRFPNNQFGFSVSHTTRPPRPGEEDGVHYNFTTVEQIKKDIADGKFIEYAEVHGKYYGTSIAGVESVQKQGKVCILDIDVQGVQKVKQSSLDPRYVFIAPPSKEELEKRLRGRGTETEEAIATRLGNAAKELEYGQTAGNFDRVFVNADLKECFESMVSQFKEWYPHLMEMAPDDEQKSCTCTVS